MTYGEFGRHHEKFYTARTREAEKKNEALRSALEQIVTVANKNLPPKVFATPEKGLSTVKDIAAEALEKDAGT